MNINYVNRASHSDTLKKSAPTAATKKKGGVEKGSAVHRQDTFTKSETQASTSGVYVRSRVNGQLVQSLMDEQQARIDSFQKMLRAMVAKQGQQSNLTLLGLDLYVTPEDSAAAAAAIAPGGEYSVDAVATRIMDMAYALSGGDASKIETLRGAVEKGFKAAGLELGGKLPDICQDTYKEVMRRFDDWEKEAAGVATL